MDPRLLGTVTALGLSSSAGLNTTLPLLMAAVAARMGAIHLAHPYAWLAGNGALALLFVLVLVEFVADKLPGLDSLMHTLQLPLAAAAGAVLFASQASLLSDISPQLALAAGVLSAGTVHGSRLVVRPAVTASTAGVGNPIVSLAEDAGAAVLAWSSIAAPFVALVLLALLLIGAVVTVRMSIRLGTGAVRHLAVITHRAP